MNNKYIFSFLFLVILTAVSLLLFNSQTSDSTTVPDTTTTTTVPVNISEDEESVQIVEEEEVGEQLLYDGPYLSFAGFEGSNQRLLEELVTALPEELKGVIKNKILSTC